MGVWKAKHISKNLNGIWTTIRLLKLLREPQAPADSNRTFPKGNKKAVITAKTATGLVQVEERCWQKSRHYCFTDFKGEDHRAVVGQCW